MPTVADLVVSRLEAAGVRALFGVPGGGGNLDLVDATRRAGLPFVLMSAESGSAIAASVHADLTGRPGACLTTLGPGAASVTNGMASAWLDRSSVIVFTDSHAIADRRRYLHQQLDHQAIARSITKRSDCLRPAPTGDPIATIDRALDAATSGLPGPAHVDCPGSVLASSVTRASALRRRRVRRRPARLAPISASVRRRLRTLLNRSKRPLVIVGLGARGADDAAAIDRCCRRHHLPALVTYKAKGVVPDDHPWFGGVFTNAIVERALVSRADLVIGIGLDPVELLPKPWPYDSPIVGLSPWPVSDGQVPFALKAVVDVRAALAVLRDDLPRSEWSQEEVASAVAAQLAAIDVRGSGPGMTAQTVIRLAADRLAATHRLAVDAGAHMLPATMLWPCRRPHDLLISNGLATMAFSLPAAIGSAVAEPRRPVVAFIGDGGLLMCAGELRTAAREQLPIIVVVFNDASLSLIEIKQRARHLPPAGVALGVADWAALGRSLGTAGFTAVNEAELVDAIERAKASSGPSVIDARIDRSNYPATFRAIRGS
jgi:acetolactate synthase-1/2/3 large subunit